MLNHKDLLASADVVILHNVFEFFVPPEELSTMWKFLRNALRKGCRVVTCPSIEHSLKNAKVGSQ